LSHLVRTGKTRGWLAIGAHNGNKIKTKKILLGLDAKGGKNQLDKTKKN